VENGENLEIFGGEEGMFQIIVYSTLIFSSLLANIYDGEVYLE